MRMSLMNMTMKLIELRKSNKVQNESKGNQNILMKL